MQKEKETIQRRSLFSAHWPVALSLLTAITAIGTVTLHIIGNTRHQQYLKYWGIDSDIFPKTTEWILINGYYGIFDRFIAILSAIFSNIHWLAAATLIGGIYIFILLTPIGSAPRETPAWLLHRPEWFRRFIKQMFLTALFMSFAPLALFFLTAFLAVPAAFGETAGTAAAVSASIEHKKGCQVSKISCVELKRNGDFLATGFLLDSSPTHIAIFDAQLQRGRVIPMENIEIISKKIIK